MYVCTDPRRRNIPIIDQKKKICVYMYVGSDQDPTKTDSSRFILNLLQSQVVLTINSNNRQVF